MQITPLLKDITKVISKGRDRLLEIESNKLVSHYLNSEINM